MRPLCCCVGPERLLPRRDTGPGGIYKSNSRFRLPSRLRVPLQEVTGSRLNSIRFRQSELKDARVQRHVEVNAELSKGKENSARGKLEFEVPGKPELVVSGWAELLKRAGVSRGDFLCVRVETPSSMTVRVLGRKLDAEEELGGEAAGEGLVGRDVVKVRQWLNGSCEGSG